MAAELPAESAAGIEYVVGVDVGTSSVRVGLVCVASGQLLHSVHENLRILHDGDMYEQSSQQAWRAFCNATRRLLADSAISPQKIIGVAFDATCSLVLLDQKFEAVNLHPTKGTVTGESQQTAAESDDVFNIVMWLDHRADVEAEQLSSSSDDAVCSVLAYVGGRISLEMQIPKILWLKKHFTEQFQSIAHFMDLSDYFAARCIDFHGAFLRSVCTTTCKWNFLSHTQNGWSKDFLHQIELDELVQNDFQRIGGRRIANIGQSQPTGLGQRAAAELGLPAGITIAVGAIDAHAGALGMLGSSVRSALSMESDIPIENRLILIAGTSSCHLQCIPSAVFVPGVWGPYRSALLPDMWLLEGGQSASGALIDRVLRMHAHYEQFDKQAKLSGKTIFDELETALVQLHLSESSPSSSTCCSSSSSQPVDISACAYLCRNLHCLPDFHGNRCPLADSEIRGIISGLSLDSQLSHDLPRLYLSVVLALAYQTRHILSVLRTSGAPPVRVVFACGGLAKNRLYLQMHADILGLPILLSKESDAVIVGSAVIAAAAAKRMSLIEAMRQMTHVDKVIRPNTSQHLTAFHHAKYEVLMEMYAHEKKCREIMKKVSASSPTKV